MVGGRGQVVGGWGQVVGGWGQGVSENEPLVGAALFSTPPNPQPNPQIRNPKPADEACTGAKTRFTRTGNIPGGRQPLWREGVPISYQPRPELTFSRNPTTAGEACTGAKNHRVRMTGL